MCGLEAGFDADGNANEAKNGRGLDCATYCAGLDTTDPNVQANLKCLAECTTLAWGDKDVPGSGEFEACDVEFADITCADYNNMDGSTICLPGGASKVFASVAAVLLAVAIAAAF